MLCDHLKATDNVIKKELLFFFLKVCQIKKYNWNSFLQRRQIGKALGIKLITEPILNVNHLGTLDLHHFNFKDLQILCLQL